MAPPVGWIEMDRRLRNGQYRRLQNVEPELGSREPLNQEKGTLPSQQGKTGSYRQCTWFGSKFDSEERSSTCLRRP